MEGFENTTCSDALEQVLGPGTHGYLSLCLSLGVVICLSALSLMTSASK